MEIPRSHSNTWEVVHEEYAAYHTALKTNVTKRAPLWYNVPFGDDSKVDTEHLPPPEEDDEEKADGGDSKSINFKTFVPLHDASLNSGKDLVADASSSLLGQHAKTNSQDEAFTRSVNAMFWTGYWTGIYRCQGSDVVDTEGNEAEGMVSAQR